MSSFSLCHNLAEEERGGCFTLLFGCSVLCLFLMVRWVGLQLVIVAFPGHTHFLNLFFLYKKAFTLTLFELPHKMTCIGVCDLVTLNLKCCMLRATQTRQVALQGIFCPSLGAQFRPHSQSKIATLFPQYHVGFSQIKKLATPGSVVGLATDCAKRHGILYQGAYVLIT